jgi:uncharacterized protein
MWSKGDTVALRDIWFGEVWRAVPAVVVCDDTAVTCLYIASGCESVYPVNCSGQEIRLPAVGARHRRRQTKEPTLVSVRRNQAWSIWHFYRDDGAFDRWYVNFERALGRSATTLDYVDHKLDLIARPDGSLTWKDEDELDEAGRLGLVDADEVRRDADRVLRDRPWPTGWEHFRPDPGWPLPTLPAGWDVVS